MAIETRKVCDECGRVGSDKDPVRTFTITEEGSEEVWQVELHRNSHAKPMLELARKGRRVPAVGVTRKATATQRQLEPRIRRRPDKP